MPDLMRPLEQLLRPNILRLQPYSSARDEFSGAAEVYLDANENPFPNGLNRYPDPYQRELKTALAKWRNVKPAQIFLGNGSDEAIDLLLRAFCQPGQDRILICPPTYGMYKVSAEIQDTEVISLPLGPDFQPDLPALRPHFSDPRNKLLFLCSPNNPTGNLIEVEAILAILRGFPGIVVLDEAYIDFVVEATWLPFLQDFPNLVILQTFSKAWGMAGLRLGAAYAAPAIISIFNKIKPPYNLNLLSQQRGLQALQETEQMLQRKDQLLINRIFLREGLTQLSLVEKVFPSEANFLLVRFHAASTVFQRLLQAKIIVRDRTSQVPGCLRLTVGTEAENTRLLELLSQIDLSLSNSKSNFS